VIIPEKIIQQEIKYYAIRKDELDAILSVFNNIDMDKLIGIGVDRETGFLVYCLWRDYKNGKLPVVNKNETH
jgi:hypothetical protein